MRAAKRSGRGSAERGTLNVSGGHIAYETAGAGAPILFIHSAIADSRLWDREFPLYAASHRVVRFDLRGLGGSSPAVSAYSPVRDVEQLLGELGIRRAFLVGSSMGGALAVDVALEHPELVSGLFLVAPGLSGGVLPPYTPEEAAAFEEDDRRSRAVSEAWSKGDRETAIERLRELWCAALEGANLRLWRKMVEQNATEIFESRSERMAERRPEAEPRLAQIRAPTTVLLGSRDNPSSEPFAIRIARAIPGAQLLRVDGADHLINLSRPAPFDRALAAALSATP